MREESEEGEERSWENIGNKEKEKEESRYEISTEVENRNEE